MLLELEQKLRDLSHCEAAIKHVEEFCTGLNGTKERLRVWNQESALIRRPIEPSEVVLLGFDTPDDQFVLLQGDIVRTEAAYFMGTRIAGRAKYTVLNSSCDLISGRSEYSCLLRIVDLKNDGPTAKSRMGDLLKFARRDGMYIPKLPDDASDVMGSEIDFDGICQIRTDDLLLANRVASLSLVGWRIFASFARVVIARANPREVAIRSAVEGIPSGQ